MATETPLRVVELQIKDVLGIKAVHIVPDPTSNVVIIGGENEQGKSNVLESIEMAVRGAGAIPSVPTRKGAKKGSIRLDLGEYVIERWGENLEKLEVRSADGTPQKKRPQDLLNGFISAVSFNPEEFSRMKPAAQLELLKKLVGLDFAELDQKRAKLYEERTGVGRALATASERLTNLGVTCLSAPDEEVSIAALLKEKDSFDKSNTKRDYLEELDYQAKAKVTRLERELSEARDEARGCGEMLRQANVRIDTSSIVASIAGAEDTNRLVRAKKDRAKASAEANALEAKKEQLTEAIEAIDADKESKLQSAKWPVPGLEFGDSCVLYDGLPFDQASAARRRQISFAIGCSINPRLKAITIPDASLLDKNAMAAVCAMAKERGMQVWLERVGDADKGAIIIEDGEIKTYSEDV